MCTYIKTLEALENIAKYVNPTNEDNYSFEQYRKDYYTIRDALEVLQILKESPFVLSKFFGNNGLKNQDKYNDKYFWGTISEENYNKVKRWLDD